MRCERCFTSSSVGAKVLMARSGLILFGFVLGHMLGNLQVFLGQETYNAYAHFLKNSGALLWGTRVALIGAVVAHVITAIKLTMANRAARPVPYATKKWRQASMASRTMAYTGLVVLAFIAYHIAPFTLGVPHPDHYALVDAAGRHDVYSMFVKGFQQPVVASLYIVANILLGLHLNHGASSLFQSLGLNHPKYNPCLAKVGPVFSGVVVLGNISMPIAVWCGVLTLPAGVA